MSECLDRAEERYADLKARLEARVVRWQWASFAAYSLEPVYFERHRYGRGKILDAPPEQPASGNEAAGLDAGGRVLVERSYTELPGRYYETFYEFRDGAIDKYHYHHDRQKPIIHVARYRFDGPRLVELEHLYRAGGRRHERFEWNGERLLRVIVDQGQNSHVDELEYDAAGELVHIEWVNPNGTRTTTYRRVTESLSSLLERLEALSLEAIPRALQALKPSEPVYAIALWVDMEAYEHVLPPGLAVAYASERQAHLDEHGPEAKDYLYSPPEWESFDADSLEYRTPDLLALAAAANQLIWQNDEFERAIEHVDTLARKLNRLDWSLHLPVTDDCVVFAVDIACGDGAAGIERAVSPEQWALLVNRGLV